MGDVAPVAGKARLRVTKSPSFVREFSEDKTRVLIRFTAMSWSGETFGGTCLSLSRNGRWGAYVIKPNQSESIVTAEG
jgi:hypothetical protein